MGMMRDLGRIQWDYHWLVDLGEIRRYLNRTAWGDFPDVLICVDESQATRHPLYPAAKVGDAKAADGLILDRLSGVSPALFDWLIAGRRPRLLAVHAVESAGMNAIPRVLARHLAQQFDLPLERGIVQLNRVTHTRADGYHRLAFPAVFDGPMKAADYLLIDDFVGQGGTLANLRGHVETQGGRVIGAISLAGKRRSAQLRLDLDTLQKLREKHGNELEEWWISTFGYGLDRLTESEAAYLYRSDDFVTITTRLAAARRAGN
jgi:hypoxanthine-guanine phosphoribosyltransferase